MIAHFPIGLLIPGLLFVAVGFFYRDRAAHADPASELGKRMAAANRRTGNMAIVMGVILLIVAVALGIAIQSLLS